MFPGFPSVPMPTTDPTGRRRALPQSIQTAEQSRYRRTKGAQAEAAVAAFLREHGFVEAERRRLRGKRDAGDIAGIAGVVVEVKDQRTLEIGKWVNEAAAEADHVGPGALPLVVMKRKGTTDAGQWFAVTTLAEMARLMGVAGYD